jgi:tetratricopeptide (TPR) repeat protein
VQQALESLNETTEDIGTNENPSPNSRTSSISKGVPQFQIKGLALQISLYQTLGSLDLACKLHQKMADLALQMGDTDRAKQSFQSILSLRTTEYAKNAGAGEALVQAHCALADFWRDHFFHW